MIKVLLELQLIYPYKRSMDTLAAFCCLWDCGILGGGTNSLRAKISMPSIHFKKIFGTNPKVGNYNVPNGMEYFINNVKVKKIIIN